MRRWACLGGGFVLIVCGGAVYGFGSIAQDVKAALAATDPEMSLISTAGTIGLWLGSFTGGLVADVWGPRVVMGAAAICIGLGYGAAWGALSSTGGGRGGRAEWATPTVVAIAWGVAGLASGWIYNATIFTNSKNWRPAQRGYIVGALATVFGLSSTMWAAILNGCVGGALAHPSNASVSGTSTSTSWKCSSASGGRRVLMNGDLNSFLLLQTIALPIMVAIGACVSLRMESVDVERAEASELARGIRAPCRIAALFVTIVALLIIVGSVTIASVAGDGSAAIVYLRMGSPIAVWVAFLLLVLSLPLGAALSCGSSTRRNSNAVAKETTFAAAAAVAYTADSSSSSSRMLSVALLRDVTASPAHRTSTYSSDFPDGGEGERVAGYGGEQVSCRAGGAAAEEAEEQLDVDRSLGDRFAVTPVHSLSGRREFEDELIDRDVAKAPSFGFGINGRRSPGGGGSDGSARRIPGNAGAAEALAAASSSSALEKEVPSQTLCQVLGNPSFWLLWLVMACVCGANVTVINIISTVVHDRDAGSAAVASTSAAVIMLVSASVRMITGIAISMLPNRPLPQMMLLVSSILCGTAQLILTVDVNSLIFVACVVLGAADGSFWASLPLVTGRVFGKKFNGSIFGLLVASAGATGIGLIGYVSLFPIFPLLFSLLPLLSVFSPTADLTPPLSLSLSLSLSLTHTHTHTHTPPALSFLPSLLLSSRISSTLHCCTTQLWAAAVRLHSRRECT